MIAKILAPAYKGRELALLADYIQTMSFSFIKGEIYSTKVHTALAQLFLNIKKLLFCTSQGRYNNLVHVVVLVLT